MAPDQRRNDDGDPIAMWMLPFDVTLGSSVRAKGIFQAVRLRLPPAVRKALSLRGSELSLELSSIPDAASCVSAVAKALEGIEGRPVIPREIQDILSIKATERHRWLKDGRLPSAGTRTVKLNGRAKKVTFHVFDPAVVRDLLDRDAIVDWREEDAVTAAENRRHAAWARAAKKLSPAVASPDESPEEAARHLLKGWDEFEAMGLLR